MSTQKAKKPLVYKKENDFKLPTTETNENKSKEIEKSIDIDKKGTKPS